MTVAFALFLSPEGIALAHRQDAGHWALIGETSLDGPDFTSRITALRRLGETRGGPGFETLLILPDDQILYAELAVADGPGTDLRAEVGRALDGRTPYALGELAYDYRHMGPGRARVAAVAQETLTEAMDFARAAGFNTIGFAATPPASKFEGIPLFELDPGAGPLGLHGVGLEFGPDTWDGETTPLPADEPGHVFVTEATPAVTEVAAEEAPEKDFGEVAETDADEVVNAAEPGIEAVDPEPEAEAEAPADLTAEDVEQALLDSGAMAEESPSADEATEEAVAEDEAEAAAADEPEAIAEATEDATAGELDGVSEPVEEAEPEAAEETVAEAEPSEVPAPVDAVAEDLQPEPAEPEAVDLDTAAELSAEADTAPEEIEPEAEPETADLSPDSTEPEADGSPAEEPGPAPLTSAPAVEVADHEAPAFDVDAPAADAALQSDHAEDGAPVIRFGAHRTGAVAPEAVGRIVRNTRSRFALVAPPRDEIPKAPETAAEPEAGAETPAAPTPPKRSARLPAVFSAPRRETPEQPAAETPQDDLPSTLPPALAERLRRRRAEAAARSAGAEASAGGSSDTGALPETAAAFTPAAADDDLPAPRIPDPRDRVPDPRIGRPVPRLPQGDFGDDALITGGLLSRRTDDGARPSLRTALVLTLVLALVLALIAVWSALFLPESRIARWLGRVAPEVETAAPVPDPAAAPEVVLAPPAAEVDGDAVTAEATPEPEVDPEAEAAIAAAAEAAAEAEAEIALAPAVAPEPVELPDIDADLPAPEPPVTPTRAVAMPSPEAVQAEYDAFGIWQLPPAPPATPANEFLIPEADEDIYLASIDPVVHSHDAVALVSQSLPAVPRASPPPPPFGVTFDLNAEGLVEPSPEGTPTPAGAVVYSGLPPLAAQPRPGPDPVAPAPAGDADDAGAAVPEADPAAAPADAAPVEGVEDAILATFLPTPRPADLSETRERQVLGGFTLDELQTERPETRPESLQEIALAQLAAAAAVENAPEGSELAVGESVLPRTRPASVVAAAEAAADRRGPAAAASTAGFASDDGEPEPVPTLDVNIPQNATVSRSATMENVINLREINLIGVTGTPSDRRALVRLPTGRFVTVSVGDRIDGGRVAAIGATSLQYVKNGRNITLEVPSG
ncbi:hypothetical protein HKCCE2091_15555 [Rhodobacterales bacterium HKCCE2091]|nr:hypothetical protein [Rhodobacterales bacterium HKCCE2091]